MPKFKAKPVIKEAVQLKWENWSEVCAFANVGKLSDGKPQGCYIAKDGRPLDGDETSDEMGLLIPTLEGVMLARQNDWVIRGLRGELYACKPDIFEKTYEPAD